MSQRNRDVSKQGSFNYLNLKENSFEFYGICLAQFMNKLKNVGKTMKYTKLMISFFLLILAGFLSGCGGNDNSVRAIVNGQQFEMKVQHSSCIAGGSVPGFGAPVTCTISFRTGGNSFFADSLSFSVSDVRAVYPDLLGKAIPLTGGSGGIVSAQMTLQAQNQVILEGVILFSHISNVRGDKVCADYELLTGSGIVDGHFCGTVEVGFVP